jgi:2-phospho-L-lactate guanylyltransferase
MSTVAILPIKSFGEAKQRLAHELRPGPRRALAEAMFSDVLVALGRTASIDAVLVVTGDRGAQEIAGGYGARVLDDQQRGHSGATLLGIAHVMQEGTRRVLLVPGDCPLLDPEEVDALTARRVGARSALIVPDRHGTGTNALLLTPPDSLEPAFGPGSCQRHAAGARAQGTPHEVVHVPSLALDIDTPEDLAALQERLQTLHGGAAQTRGMLNQLNRSGFG